MVPGIKIKARNRFILSYLQIITAISLVSLALSPSVFAQNPELSLWTKNISESAAETEGKDNDFASEVVVAGSIVHVLWITYEYDDNNQVAEKVYYRRSIDNGTTWLPKLLVYTSSDRELVTDQTYKRMVVEGSYVHIAVSSTIQLGDGKHGRLEYIQSADSGETFKEPRTIYTAAQLWWVYDTYITASNGKVSIGFRTQCNYLSDNAFLLLNSDDHGDTFHQETIYDTSLGSSWKVHDLQREGDTICGLYTEAYYMYGLQRGELFISCSNNAGQNFTSTRISVPSANGSHKANPHLQDYHYVPKIAINGGTVSVIWTGQVSNSLEPAADIQSVMYSRSTDSGMTFAAPVNLSKDVLADSTAFQAGQETLVAKGNHLYTILVSTGGNIYLRRSADGGGSFFAPQELTAPGEQNIGSGWWPVISTDPTDPDGAKVHVLWNTPTYCSSADGGSTFTKPVLVSPEYSYGGAMVSRTNRPAMAIGSDGKIHFTFEGRYLVDKYYDFDILYRGISSQPAPFNTPMALRLYSNLTEKRFDNVQVPSSQYLNFTTTLTAEVWVKPSAGGNTTGTTSAVKPVFFKMKDYMGRSAYALGTWDRGNRQAFGSISTTDGDFWAAPSASAAGLVPDNVWTHLAITYDAAGGQDNFKLYMNGQLIHAATATGTLLNGDGQFFMGYYGNWEIDELRLWSVVRSQEQIADSMAVSMAGTEPGLNACYTLNGSTKDISGHGNDGILMYKEEYVDLAGLQDILIGLQIITGQQATGETILDVDGDGKIGMTDVIHRLREAAGLQE